MNRNQVRTLLWLRWRLSQNQWARRGAWSAALSFAAMAFGILLIVGGFAGGIVAGYAAMAKASPQVTLLVWDAIALAFLFFWTLGIVTEIQRSETIDIQRLLHLPISLREVFLVNYFASHLTLSIFLFVPAMLGLAVGLAAAKGLSALLLVPLTLGFIFMTTAWTYCLRGWLVSLMVNQRRRRTIIVGITTAFILLGQLPNLYFNVIRNRDPEQKNRVESKSSEGQSSTAQARRPARAVSPAFIAAHNYIPPLWLARGAFALANGDAWPAMGGSLVAFLIGGLGLRRAYRATIRFYQGAVDSRPAKRKEERARAPIRPGDRLFIERKLPGVPEEAAAMALASFRSMTRAPEVRMALTTSFAMMLVFGTMMFVRGAAAPPEGAKPFIATGAAVFVMFGMLQLLFNQFGFDRNGFRALVLLPTQRRLILLGKNLAFMPIALGAGIIFLIVLTIFARVPPAAALAAALQLATTFLLVCIAGNYVSVIAPYRIAAGSLKPTKTPAKTILLIFLSHLLFPVAVLPIFVPPVLELLFRALDWLPFLPVNLLLSLILLAVVAFFYHLSLGSLGDLLQRREREILQVVTQEVE